MFNIFSSSFVAEDQLSVDYSSKLETTVKTRNTRRSRRRRNASKAKVEPITKPKHHDAPMTKNDLYFALDCEMVGTGPDGFDSAVARVTILNWEKEIVLDTFVKVPVPVTDYRTHVSGIQSHDIESDHAMTFEEVRRAVEHIIRGKILIGHGLDNDLCALGLTHPWCDVRDTACYGPYMRETVVDPSSGGSQLLPRKLRDLAWEKLGRLIQEDHKPHSPLEDAGAALDLYKAARVEWEGELSRIQVKEFQMLEHRRASTRYFGHPAPSLMAAYEPTPVPYHVSCDQLPYNGNYQPQVCTFSPSTLQPDAPAVVAVEEKSSRFWFRVKSQERPKSPIKEDQEYLDSAPVSRPMSPRSSSLFSFRRSAVPRRILPSVSIETATSTIDSESENHNRACLIHSWPAEDAHAASDATAWPGNSNNPPPDVDSLTFEALLHAAHPPLRSRLPTYLSVTSHEAEMGDYDNIDWDEDAFGLYEHHPASSLEPNAQEWQPPYCESSLWSNNFNIMPQFRNSM